MKYAFVSDIHGNLQAWTQVWASLSAENVDGVICLGDIIGYGPRPAETLASVRSKVNFCVIGNHDAVIAGLEDPSRFNKDAQNLIHWSAEKMDNEAKEYFSKMPYELNLDTEHEVLRCVHGSPFEPEMFWYVSNANEARLAWDSTDTQITFIGHSHVPGYFTLSPDNEVKYREGNNLLYKIEEGTRYIINAGSVGLSRDGDRRAAYCVYDSDTRTFYWRRVDFDLEEYRADVKSNMPDKTMATFVLDNFELSVETQAIKKFTNFEPSDETQRLTIARPPTIQTINVRKNFIKRRKTGSTQTIQPIKKEKRPNPAKTKLIIFIISALVLAGVIAIIFIIENKKSTVKQDKKTKPLQNQVPVKTAPIQNQNTRQIPRSQSNINDSKLNINTSPVNKQKATPKPNYVFSSNFDKEKKGKKVKTVWVNPDYCPIEPENLSKEQKMGLIFRDNSSNKGCGMAKLFDDVKGKMTVKFKIKPEKENPDFYVSLLKEKKDKSNIIAFQIYLKKEIEKVNELNYYKSGKFITFQIDADIKSAKYSLLMDNKPVFMNRNFKNKISKINKIRFNTDKQDVGNLYFDDLEIFYLK